jgi:hypothetical protein
VTVKFFRDSALLVKAELDSRSGPEYRFDDVLEESLVIDDLDDEYVSCIFVACRSGSVTVAIDYSASADETYTVIPGAPLLVNTKDTDTVASITVAPVGESAEVEVHQFTGTVPVAPTSAYLILDAAKGVVAGDFDPGSVETWTDTRPVSLAPLPFEWDNGSAARPTLIASDPDFGGKPSVDFSDSGSWYLQYSGAASVFNFMRGIESMTMMMICSVPDDATSKTNGQGIWNCSSSAGSQGWRAGVDGAYRLDTYLASDGFQLLAVDEFAPKAMVVVWRFDFDSEIMRTYWQGLWRDQDFALGAGVQNQTALAIGAARDSAEAGIKYFRGKIAHMVLYNDSVSETVINDYIAMAVSEYGVVDTPVQGFPWIADCNWMHRANRGFVPSSSTADLWNDTRPENTLAGGGNWFVTKSAGENGRAGLALFNGHWGIEFNGTTGKATLSFSGTEEDFLGGDNAFTISFIYYREDTGSIGALLTMGTYDSAGLDGIGIYSLGSGTVRYELDNSADDNVVFDSGSPQIPASTPRLFVFRVDGASYYIDELELDTGETFSVTGPYGGTASATLAASTLYMGVDGDNASFLSALNVAEHTAADEFKSDEEVATLFAYALNRYGTV